MVVAPLAEACACTKSVRWYDDAPYSFAGPDGEVSGFQVDLVRAVLERIGCKPSFVHMPWARALVELEAGRLDILPGSYRNAQRERFAHFSVPALQSPNVLYLAPGINANYHIAALDDLVGTGFRLGVQIGVSYGPKFDALKDNPKFKSNMVPVTLRRSAWQMMYIGRLDGIIADPASAALELKQLGLDEALLPSKVVVSNNTAMFALSKQTVTQDFVARFNGALTAMIGDGQYQKIRARYMSCPADLKLLGCK